MQVCSRLKKLLKENSKDNILIESLWTSALVRYARCFACGKRTGLSEDIFKEFQGDPVEAHRFYINLRNKHIAHSVNPFEQMEVGLILSPIGESERRVLGVSVLAMKQISLSIDGVHQLGLLSKIAHDKMCNLAKELENKVIEKGKKTPIEELYKKARPRLIAPEPDLANKPRK